MRESRPRLPKLFMHRSSSRTMKGPLDRKSASALMGGFCAWRFLSAGAVLAACGTGYQAIRLEAFKYIRSWKLKIPVQVFERSNDGLEGLTEVLRVLVKTSDIISVWWCGEELPPWCESRQCRGTCEHTFSTWKAPAISRNTGSKKGQLVAKGAHSDFCNKIRLGPPRGWR